MSARAAPVALTGFCLVFLLACSPVLLAQERSAPEDLATRTLPLRTALHNDPTLDAPLETLVKVYREAGRTGELVGIYRRHLTAYPGDRGAMVVLVRILEATGDPGALQLARSAVTQHPDDAYLHFMLYRVLATDGDPGAFAELDRAVELEAHPARKQKWLDVLLSEATGPARRRRAQKHLETLAATVTDRPQAAFDLARKMMRHGFHALALEVLESARKGSPAPELSVEIEMAAASAQESLG
ncbi:MAG: hypothetical protein AMS16_06580, partial [Planctomycetes bacterium DG_58]